MKMRTHVGRSVDRRATDIRFILIDGQNLEDSDMRRGFLVDEEGS